jgi:hypothetical protein
VLLPCLLVASSGVDFYDIPRMYENEGRFTIIFFIDIAPYCYLNECNILTVEDRIPLGCSTPFHELPDCSASFRIVLLHVHVPYRKAVLNYTS